ncbi:MAG TPA: histidine kinase [Chitinophagaceae bacterium]|jgi:hypothetical protein|nr:histidine kinase [Chitinophagaceae bacterium]
MPHRKEKINDKWFRFLGIPVLVFLSHVIFYSGGEVGSTDEGFNLWQIYLISIVEVVILWEPNRLVIAYFRNRFPGIRQTQQRILGLLGTCLSVTVLVRFLNLLFYDLTRFWGYDLPAAAYVHGISVALLFMVIVGGIYETAYYFRKWKQLFSETEALKRENLQTQLDSLKAQINPHFLFNNLSSLVPLIMEDQAKAVTFVNELSSVYRYLLQANTKNLVPLRVELKFISHYFHLLKTRFEEGVELRTDIGERYLDHALPPLTLQILLENAVKHNAVLPRQPLVIHLFTDDSGHLVVRNNLQKKNNLVASNKLGLQNIRTKYELLGAGAVRIRHTPEYFEVTLPLFKQEAYEHPDR